ncbi:ABC transporter substrate-binding protein [Corynebacterium senegalense]|uniref:taurine ABC transporter substrate-binding protein n=1 Tax=Corynebacterium senegalense TaxID=2080750 RepID=UPI000E200706|nr:ABC transporter substrate-binding protein [Corynebacterium senegalense]
MKNLKQLAALGAIVSAAGLSACVGPTAAEIAGKTGNIECPFEPVHDKTELRLAFQIIPGSELYLKDQRIVEECLPDTKVSWTKYATGQDIVQAFAAGSADVGYLGSPPVAKLITSPISYPAKVIHVNNVTSSSEALVSKKYTKLEELRGKRVGVAFSSTAHYSLLKALESVGLKEGRDVEIVNLAPGSQVAAYNGDQVDAIYAWDPTLKDLQATGANTIITSKEVGELGAPTFNFGIADANYINAHPETIAMVTKLEEWAAGQYEADPEQFIAANARETGDDAATDEELLSRSQLVPKKDQERYLREAGATLLDTAEFFAEQGQVDHPSDPALYESAVTYGGKELGNA